MPHPAKTGRSGLTDGASLTQRPNSAQVKLVRVALAPWRLATSPRFARREQCPRRDWPGRWVVRTDSYR